jgi:hypothetical protein
MDAFEINSDDGGEGSGSTMSSSQGEDSLISSAHSPSTQPAVAQSTDEYPSVAVAAEAASAAPTNAASFEGVDPSFILPQLLELPPDEIIGGKAFWKTYTRWEKLDSDQRGKVVLFWSNSLKERTRRRVLDAAREKIAAGVSEENARQAITSKHDKARLLHLRVDPGAQADWTAALREKTRSQLDSKDPRADPYNRLAEKFNDYEHCRYQNAVVVPNKLSQHGCYIPVAGMESLALHCHDINPTATGRPIRDAGWIRTQYKDLKSKITICFQNYEKSGNQEAENVYDEWAKFSCSFSNDAVTYARALFPDSMMDQLGRALPSEVQRDTGVVDAANTYDSRVADEARRKKAVAERKRRGNRKREAPGSESSVSREEESNKRKTVAEAIEEIGLKQLRIEQLKVILQFGDVEQKEAAMRELVEGEAMC